LQKDFVKLTIERVTIDIDVKWDFWSNKPSFRLRNHISHQWLLSPVQWLILQKKLPLTYSFRLENRLIITHNHLQSSILLSKQWNSVHCIVCIVAYWGQHWKGKPNHIQAKKSFRLRNDISCDCHLFKG